MLSPSASAVSVLLLLCSPSSAGALNQRVFNRGLTEGELRVLKYIEKGIQAANWQPKSQWIHHNEFNIVDAFELDFDLVHEAREEAKISQNLIQID